MSQAFNRSQDIRNQLNGVSNKGELTNSQRHLLNAELAMLTLQLAQQQKDLDNNTTLQDLALKRQSLAGVQITQLEQEIQALQSRTNAKRLNNSEKTAADVVSEASATENRNPLIDKELRINQQLSERLISATEQINQLVQENIQVS